VTIPDPLAALCALLDRSIVQIAEASADARVFDRATIIGVSDVWDNNTFPLFRAAVGEPRRGRKKRALDAPLWMSEFRREWMVEQAAIAGFALAEDLPPNPPQVPYRDFASYVHPMHRPLESGAIAEIAADYHLEAEAAAPDLHGLAMTPTAEGIKIAIGESGFVHAADGHLSIADVTWHLSKAGRRADAEIRAAARPKGRPNSA
jgi:hypothetical protein